MNLAVVNGLGANFKRSGKGDDEVMCQELVFWFKNWIRKHPWRGVLKTSSLFLTFPYPWRAKQNTQHRLLEKYGLGNIILNVWPTDTRRAHTSGSQTIATQVNIASKMPATKNNKFESSQGPRKGGTMCCIWVETRKHTAGFLVFRFPSERSRIFLAWWQPMSINSLPDKTAELWHPVAHSSWEKKYSGHQLIMKSWHC